MNSYFKSSESLFCYCSYATNKDKGITKTDSALSSYAKFYLLALSILGI